MTDMVILGLLLIALAVIAILGGVFLVDGGNVEYFGMDVPPVTLFVVGALSVVFIGLGAKLMASGTKRSIQARREHKQLEKLAEQRQADADPGREA
ncbi:hypothetical protein ASD30_23630 [Nocardioides sp. Root140]|nr:hypothetical protein ASD30_23630 [Nocardioides sp. Root140]